MGGLLDELGKRLADRWLPLLVLPGAFYLAVAIAAHTLGQSHPFNLHRLTTQVIAWAKTPVAASAGGQVVLLAAALAGAAAAGLAAQALGTLAERLTLAAGWSTWIPPLRQLAHSRVENRQRRWDAEHDTYSRLYQHALEDNQPALNGDDPESAEQAEQAEQAERHTAYRARTRIAPERPARPTWSGDRIYAVNVRLKRDLHLDLPTIWPGLWLTLPDTARSEITTARQALASATALTAWAVLYALLAGWWWPASLIAVILAVTGWHRTRTSVGAYATLLEASTRLYARDLAHHLGVDQPMSSGKQAGESLTAALHTEPPLAPSP
jgi:hypothetical protein